MTGIDNSIRKGFKNAFIAIWLISSVFFGLELAMGFASGWIMQSVNLLYVGALIVLFLTSDVLTERSIVSEKLINLKGYDIWGLLIIITGVTALLLFLGIKSSVIIVMAVVSFAIALWIIFKYKEQINKSLIIRGVTIGSLCAFAQYNYFLSFLFIFILAPLFFISASILNDRFKVTTVHLNKPSYAGMLKSFLMGCLLALPMALSNLSEVLATNTYTWITQFWQPLLAFNFVLLEETFMRLFILTFIYVLVSSKTDRKLIPLIAAILISATIFGLSHYPHVTILNCVGITVLYGLPLGLLFYKRGFEAAVGYHFMINFLSAVWTYGVIN